MIHNINPTLGAVWYQHSSYMIVAAACMQICRMIPNENPMYSKDYVMYFVDVDLGPAWDLPTIKD